MKQYEKYRLSGIEWLGEIPELWKVKRLKYISYMKGRIGWQNLRASEFTFNEDEPFLITGMNFKNGKINWVEVYHISEERYNEAPEIQLKMDDILMTKDGTIGKLLFVDHLPGRASLNSHLLLLRPLDDEYEPKFLYYLLDSTVFKQYIEIAKTGTTFFGITQEAVGDFYSILPSSKAEQTAIAAYLDEKTARIDKLIANKQRLIELLKEERTAIINHAVTKGINPKARLKPSGIEWLGDIPEHWEVKKLKYVARMQGGFAFNSGDFISEGVQLIRISNLYQNEFSLERQPTYLPEHFVEEYTDWVVTDGDILISMTGTLGKRDYGFAIKIEGTEKKFLLNQRVSKITFDETKVIKELALYILRSTYYQDQLFLLPTGTKQGNLSNEQVLSVPIIFPEKLLDQKELIAYIETSTQKIDATISKIEKEIELMQEYRTALISEVVTGKIKVI